MIYLNQCYELLTGGFFIGDKDWSKAQTEIDNCFKIYQLESGEVSIITEGETHLLQSKKLYFINGFKIKEQFCNSHFTTFWFHFIPKDLKIYHRLQSLPAIVELTESDIHLDSPYSIARLTDYDNNSADNLLFSLHLQNLLGQITLELLSRFPDKEINMSPTLLKIEPAIEYINNNYRSAIKLEELAQICFMSTNHFHTLFKKNLQITPANYQTVLKMNAALQMLSSSDLPIKNIAADLGFVDNAHFTKTFKTHYGISPKAYRMKKDKTTTTEHKGIPLKSTKIFC